MEYGQLLDAYKALVNQLIGSKVAEDSISPTDVAQAHIQLAELLEPILNTINDFAITGGTLPPVDASGQDLDLYIQGGSTLAFWRKRNGVWIMEAEVDLGIQIIDGVLSLQASVSGQVVTVTAGSWAINNVIYSKATQTQMNLTPANLNFDRIDAVIANDHGEISLLDGVASATPVQPNAPANSIIVAYVYIPSESSGNLPYISDSNVPASPPLAPLADGVITPGAFSINGSYLANFTEPFVYRLNNVVYTGIDNSLQLDAPDALYTRVDLIVGNSSGNYEKVTGVAEYSATPPPKPANKTLLATIYRYADGSNRIIINNTNQYAPLSGANFVGGVDIGEGNNLSFSAFKENTGISDDTGDIIYYEWIDGVKTEVMRIFKGNHNDNTWNIRFGTWPNPYYNIIHTGISSTVKAWEADPENPTIGLPVAVDQIRWVLVGSYYSLFKSAEDNNTVKPAFGIPEWDALSFNPATTAIKINQQYDESFLVEEYEGQYYLNLVIPDGKIFLSAAISVDGEDIIRYKSISDLVRNDTWEPFNYRLQGFDNNSPQTITITYI